MFSKWATDEVQEASDSLKHWGIEQKEALMSTIVKEERRGRQATILGLALVALIAVGALAWFNDWLTISQPGEVANPPTALPDGEQFVFIKGVAGTDLVVDQAEMLSGDEARQAATEDGVIQPGEDLPNDFYIRNKDESTVIIGVSAGSTPQVLTFGSDGQITETDISYDLFTAALRGESVPVEIYGVSSDAFPVTATVKDGEITALSQVYLP